MSTLDGLGALDTKVDEVVVAIGDKDAEDERRARPWDCLELVDPAFGDAKSVSMLVEGIEYKPRIRKELWNEA